LASQNTWLRNQLRVFYASADQIADPRHRQSAVVVAEDQAEALALSKSRREVLGISISAERDFY